MNRKDDPMYYVQCPSCNNIWPSTPTLTKDVCSFCTTSFDPRMFEAPVPFSRSYMYTCAFCKELTNPSIPHMCSEGTQTHETVKMEPKTVEHLVEIAKAHRRIRENEENRLQAEAELKDALLCNAARMNILHQLESEGFPRNIIAPLITIQNIGLYRDPIIAYGTLSLGTKGLEMEAEFEGPGKTPSEIRDAQITLMRFQYCVSFDDALVWLWDRREF